MESLFTKRLPIFHSVHIDGKEQTSRFNSLYIQQSLNSCCDFELVETIATRKTLWKGQSQELLKQVGKNVIIRLSFPRGENTYQFSGYITEVVIDSDTATMGGSENKIRIIGKGSPMVLDDAPSMNSFVDYDLVNIVEKVFKNKYFDLICNPKFKAIIPYAMQYKESRWEFLNRLSAIYNELLYFDGSKLVFGSVTDEHSENLTIDEDITEFKVSSRTLPFKYTLYNYNAEDDEYIYSDTEEEVRPRNAYTQNVFQDPENLYSERGMLSAQVPTPLAGDTARLQQSKYQQSLGKMHCIEGKTHNSLVRLGSLIYVKFPSGFEKENMGEYRVISVEHCVDRDDYYNRFVAVPLGMEYPLYEPRTIAYPEIAEVVANDDPEKQGRVQVRFFWQRHLGEQTSWLRVQTADAGVLTDNSGNRGFQFIPEVGDQVMVSFEQGNPHRPYVSGSMYHGKNTQQVSNNIRSITTKSGSTIVFDDTEKSVLIQNKAGSRELLDGKGNIDVNTPKTISFTAGEDITMKATKNITLNASQNYNLTTGNNMSTNVGNNVVIAIINKDTYDSGDYTETVRGNKNVVVTGDFKETTGSYSHNAIKGDALITSTGVSKVIGKQDAIVNKGYFEKEADESEKQEEAQPSTDCTVTFKLGKNENNNFGFDSYEVSKKGCKDKEKLKKAYKKLEPFREEYLMPWISLGKGETIFLKQKIKGKYKEITFKEPKSYFTFEPATITPETKQVKITCNDTITEKEYKVEVLADGKVAGGLMFVENSVKQIIIRPVFVLESKNDKQKIEFEKEVGKILLKNYLKKAFTPSLIEVDVKEPYKLSLSENDYIHPDKALNYIRGIRACFNIKNGIEIKNPTDDKREELIKNLNQLFILSKIENKIETINEIILFLTNFQCTGDKSAKEVPDSNNGFTYGKSVIMMFLGNENKKPKVEIPHEIMHALGLEHTFDPKETYLFTKGATKNYMDYDNSKEYTFKWQWVKMRESKWITLPLLFLLFVLNACSSYKNINCNYDYSIKEEEKKIDTLSSDFKWDTEKKVNNDVFWYIRPTKYFKGEGISKIIIKDTLGIKLYKGIDYDLQGNIIFSNFTLGTSYIGMEYDYDKEGNIIKETNHNKGWHLCWQQALYLGKKRMRKPNKDKEDLDLRIYKDERKNYKFWVLLYTDKRYKDRAVIIYDQTGKTRKAIKIRNSFIDDQIEDTSSNNNKDSLQ